MPEPLGALVRGLPWRRQVGISGKARPSEWLFPGRQAGRHQHPNNVRTRLNKIGIECREIRNAALTQLAAEVPAAVLADMLGFHVTTAIKWVDRVAGKWVNYVASKVGNRNRSTEAKMSVQSMTTEFGPFGDRVWLNCAHQGPLPRPAAEAAREAIAEKRSPHLIRDEAFWDVPARLKELIGWLINTPTSEIVLGNSTTYGLNLLVQGLRWQEGDEVLLIDGDFPATVVTWLPLKERGIEVRLLTPRTGAITAEELEQALGPSTRVFCSSWVFSFFGHAIDIDAIGEVCRDHEVLFVLNGSQAIGTRCIDVTNSPVDVLVSCGFKWLCGPYATGFCWMGSDLLDSLHYKQAYWLAQISKEDLSQEKGYELTGDRDASSYDVFCTANFLNFMPWTKSIQTLLDAGIDEIASHNDALVDQLISGLDQDRFELVSPAEGPERSTLVLVAPRDRSKTPGIYRALETNGIDVALRGDKIRFSPHLYNSGSDIDRALEVLSVNA